MIGLDNMNARLRYQGGNAESRMQKDKLRGLKRALLYSYQAETIALSDGREFRCLINPDNLKMDYDIKILSIPFEDICLNAEKEADTTTAGLQPINLKTGDTFFWKRTNTYWIVCMDYLEESAYYRAEIRKCTDEVDLGGKYYKAYIKGPKETTIPWNQKAGIVWNDMNYKIEMYIAKDEYTSDYFARFKTLKIDGNTYQVQAVNKYNNDANIIVITLKEYFNNTILEESLKDKEDTSVLEYEIEGPAEVHPYDIVTYKLNVEASEYNWVISNKKAHIIATEGNAATVEILTGRSGEFEITCNDYFLPVTILSL